MVVICLEGHYKSKKEPIHGREYSIRVNLPPLGGIILKRKDTKKIQSKQV